MLAQFSLPFRADLATRVDRLAEAWDKGRMTRQQKDLTVHLNLILRPGQTSPPPITALGTLWDGNRERGRGPRDEFNAKFGSVANGLEALRYWGAITLWETGWHHMADSLAGWEQLALDFEESPHGRPPF